MPFFFMYMQEGASLSHGTDSIRAGTIQSESIQTSTDTAIMLYRYRWWWQLQKTTNIPDPKLFVSHLIFIQFNKKLMHIEFDLNYSELLICGKNWSLCFRTCIKFCRIHCIDQSKTFTLLMKSKILDFEILSRVHVYRIVSVRSVLNTYRYGWWPYRPSPRLHGMLVMST